MSQAEILTDAQSDQHIVQQTVETVPGLALKQVDGQVVGAEFQLGQTKYDYLGETPTGKVFQTTDQEGTVRPILVYKSRSGGSYRVSQGIEEIGTSRRIMKGPELSTDSQYTQDTQLHPAFDEMVVQIEETAELRGMPKGQDVVQVGEVAEALFADFEKQTEVYPLGSSVELNTLLHKLKANELSKDNVKAVTRIDPYEQPAAAWSAFEAEVATLNRLLVESGTMPDFSSHPTSVRVPSYENMGNVVVEVFTKEVRGVPYEWHMAHNQDGQVWIDRIRFPHAEASPYGTDKQMVYSGILTSKPLDYKDQADGLPADMRKEVTPVYDDITPFLQKLAPIAEYSKYYHSRDQYYHFIPARA